MTVGQKIKNLLKEHAMTKVCLAKKLGLKGSSAVSQWIKGRINPGMENKAKLAQVFGKPVSYFEDEEDYSYTGLVMDKREDTQRNIEKLLSSFPVIRPVEVRKEVADDFFDLFVYSQPSEFLPVMFEAKPAAPFALKITGDKACPWAQKGEYAIFSPIPPGLSGAAQSVHGKIALVKVRGLSTIKKIFKEGDFIYLEDKHKKRKKYPLAGVEIEAQLTGFYRKP